MNSPSATQTSPNGMVVACLGDSLTAAEVSYDWIGDLQSRPQNASIRFVNFGVGRDLSYNALKRLPQMIQCRPDKVIVLIGGNDVLAAIDPIMRHLYGPWKHLPQKPSSQWFEENVRQIVGKLKNETTARVALGCSLPIIGEDPESEANRHAEEYNAIIKQIAREENVKLHTLLRANARADRRISWTCLNRICLFTHVAS